MIYFALLCIPLDEFLTLWATYLYQFIGNCIILHLATVPHILLPSLWCEDIVCL